MSRPLLHRPSPGPQPAGIGRRGLLAGASLGLSGVLLIVAGSFLPWLTSGGVQRSSYAIAGIVRRLRFVDGGPVALALSAWPALGAVAMVPIVAGIVRRWRFAALATIALSVLAGVVGGVALAVAGGHRAAGISLASVGPVVTVAGASTSLAGAIVVLASGRALRRLGPEHRWNSGYQGNQRPVLSVGLLTAPRSSSSTAPRGARRHRSPQRPNEAAEQRR